MKQKYLAVSYDDDQQQWFWDYVVAESKEDAVKIVCDARPYCIAADAADLEQVEEIAHELRKRSKRRIMNQFRWDTQSCYKCGLEIQDAEYQREPDGTVRHLNACPTSEEQ